MTDGNDLAATLADMLNVHDPPARAQIVTVALMLSRDLCITLARRARRASPTNPYAAFLRLVRSEVSPEQWRAMAVRTPGYEERRWSPGGFPPQRRTRDT